MNQARWRSALVLLAAAFLTLSAGACTPGRDAAQTQAWRDDSPSGASTPVGTASGPSYYVSTPIPGDYRLTQADDGETIELIVGQEFLVSLTGSAKHTYRVTEIDNSILEQVGSVSLGEGFSRGVFRIRAVGTGATTIRFEHGPIGLPDKRTKLTVHVTVR
jgi:hypothetical protein